MRRHDKGALYIVDNGTFRLRKIRLHSCPAGFDHVTRGAGVVDVLRIDHDLVAAGLVGPSVPNTQEGIPRLTRLCFRHKRTPTFVAAVESSQRPQETA